ncbi:alpha-hydroxy-acid oxidizing protein [Lachnoclostridium sp. Marseille-P6806]|uniref:alpha-hydroxy-acid oxidizing protein n=1 Tax=Lachnoclostridium sp. Marseille-P6806 TaxID=2364793 RepID=UPI00103143E1|nr:alpha-hydroxy-acid oxidizing protein [Lachnoclostridium sp. Marseille-P6806]
MNYNEMLENARTRSGPYCKACLVCNGRACGSQMPGPGAKGCGDTAIRNFEAWKKLRINMDTLNVNAAPDTSFRFFGHAMKYPIFAGPVGAVNLHYGDMLDDMRYNEILVSACADAGIAAFTGDGTNPEVMRAACRAIAYCGGNGIPTVKPWDEETLREKFALVRDSSSFAVAMDIDAAGLPFLADRNPPAGSKTVGEMAEIIREAGKPFIIKGIMTVRGAHKAKEAGASVIVVSNHGGRVLDQCPATAEVLPAIADAVGKDMMILVDGGIRDGVDVFKALALGADAVIVARPYVTAVYGGAAEGVQLLTEKLGGELRDTMKMCGVSRIEEISREQLFELR